MRMRSGRAALVGAALCAIGAAGPAQGLTLDEALAAAYASSPALQAERAKLRATDETVPQALSGYRPTLQASGTFGRQRDNTTARGLASEETNSPASLGVDLVQPVYDGGRAAAAVRQAEGAVRAQRAALNAAEQEILLATATAYMDALRDLAVLDLARNNEMVLGRQLELVRERFRVGDLTQTDVSIAESRLARAQADRVQAEGQLEASRAGFMRVVGKRAERLSRPKQRLTLPATLDEALAAARAANPAVLGARASEEAASAAVDRERSALLPDLNLRAGVSRGWDTGRGIDRADTASVTAQLRIPLYDAGLASAKVREAKQGVAERRHQADDALRRTEDEAIRAWQALATARAAIDARRSQIRAAEIALEGVRNENKVGTRTTAEVLDAEQELLDARVEMVRAEHDEVAASYRLLAAVGGLNTERLALAVDRYDADAHHQRARGRWWGTDE